MDLDGPVGDSLSYPTSGWIALKFNGNRDILLGFGLETLTMRVDPRPGPDGGFVGLFNEAGRRARAVAAYR